MSSATSTYRVTIGQGLRAAREATGERTGQRVTQERAAEQLGISPALVRAYEAGRHPIKLEDVPRIARTYGMTTAELLAAIGLLDDATRTA